MLNSAAHEICPAHKCFNVNNCWQFHIIQYKIKRYLTRLRVCMVGGGGNIGGGTGYCLQDFISSAFVVEYR